MNDRIPLARLPRALHELTGAAPPAYQALYRRVLNCELPAEQRNGRWYVAEERLPDIARSLGLKVPTERRRSGRTAA